MFKAKTIATIAAGLSLFAGVQAQATSIALYELPQGNTIMQVNGAAAINTGGGLAVSDRRTIYYYSPDFGDPQINFHDYTGGNWAYVYLQGILKVDDGISALVETANDGVGDFILINGNPIYQFINDLNSKDANGNFGPWFFIQPDGTPTQSTVVPLPAALPLMLAALAGLGLMRRSR